MKRFLLILPLLCLAAGDAEIEGWKIVNGAWEANPLRGKGFLEWPSGMGKKFSFTANVSYRMTGDQLWGLILFHDDELGRDKNCVRVLARAEADRGLTIDEVRDGNWRVLARSDIPSESKGPLKFSCVTDGRSVKAQLGRTSVHATIEWRPTSSRVGMWVTAEEFAAAKVKVVSH
ncbi:MAG: hypothetical protein AB1696_13210 [Planctomycetota bacterium]